MRLEITKWSKMQFQELPLSEQYRQLWQKKVQQDWLIKQQKIANNAQTIINYWNRGMDHNGYLLQWIDLYNYVLKEYKSLIVSKKIMLLKFSRNLDYSFCEKIIDYCEIINKDQLSNYFKKFSASTAKKDNKLFNLDKKDVDKSYEIYNELTKLSDI